MTEKFVYNQAAWFVARDNFKNHTIEYLDNERDVFYVEGVTGYTTKEEARERAERYKGDVRGLFIMGPKYGRYRILDARRPGRKPKNIQLARFEMFDRMNERNPTPEAAEELRSMIRSFIKEEGIWCMSNLPKTRDLVSLILKYQVLTDAELVKVIYARG